MNKFNKAPLKTPRTTNRRNLFRPSFARISSQKSFVSRQHINYTRGFLFRLTKNLLAARRTMSF